MIDTTVSYGWYFYAGKYEYYCKLDRSGKPPRLFRGPYASRARAQAAYRQWLADNRADDEEQDNGDDE